MTSSRLSDGLAPQSRPLTPEAWSPPPFLLEMASAHDGLIAELADAFATDTSARIQQVQAALAALDFSRISAEAHTIKGSAKQVGADALADACEELENACERRDALLVAARLHRLQELFEAARRAMASYCNRQRSSPLP